MKILTEFLDQLTIAKDSSYIREVNTEDGRMSQEQLQRFVEVWNDACANNRQIKPARVWGTPRLMIRNSPYKSATAIAQMMIERKPELAQLID